MLPRRSSTGPGPSYTLQNPPSTSSVRRPLSIVTNQQPFRATTAQTIETESPQSKESPEDTSNAPPMPPRPPAFPQLPPRSGGLRRQSTRLDTYETFSSVPEFPQPPGFMLMHGPPPPQTPVYPPTPMPSRQPIHGEGPGGFAMASSPLRGPGREYPHQPTSDYAYRFDTMPSPRSDSDSDPPHYESEDISGGVHANVWPAYNKISQEFDEKTLSKWNTDLDVLLIFAALFSAIVTAFVTLAIGDLQPDYQQQSALLLYQLLNGRDPSLASISDPTIPFEPSGFAVAVNCLWFASLSASLGASFGAMICKEWLTEYNGGSNPVVDLLRACQRQIRFNAFQRWNVHTLIALLPPLLHSSVIMFFSGAVIYLWQIDSRVAMVYLVIGGIFGITYFLSTFLPMVTNAPFRPYSTLIAHRLSVVVGGFVISFVDVIVHGCFLALRYVTGAVLWPFAQTIFSKGALHNWYMKTRTILPGEYKHMRVWWADAFDDSLDKIDISQNVQEEAILWLSQMPLDPSESKAVVSSLSLISDTRPHRYSKSMIVFLNLTLESAFLEAPGQLQASAIDCVLVLGHIKFQTVVDRNLDQDLYVGDVPVTTRVAYAAQQLTISAFNENFNTPHSEGIRARLLTAAAWLSPVDAFEVTSEGESLKIQDRWEFVKRIRMTLEQHVRSGKPLDNRVLINLIHGMHACIPRGNYGSPSLIIPFLPLICEDYGSPWSEDESVLRALITYALDLITPLEWRKPLVEREIKFNKLTSELIDALMVDATSTEVVAFGFWLIYRVPYAFRSRKSILADIVHIWASANAVIPEDHRKRMNFHAVDAFVAIAQCRLAARDKLPRLAAPSVLDLLGAALEDGYSRSMATYALALILNLGTSTQVTTFSRGVDAALFANTLHTVRNDLEGNAAEEDILDLHIYTTLLLLKLRRPPVDVERVKAMIGEMGQTIGDSVARDSGLARDSKAEIDVDLDRVKWKAIYLSGLLVRFLPPGEWEGPIEALRERVRTLLRSGELLVASDSEHCLEPLDVGQLELKTPAERGDPLFTAFEEWIEGFPLFPLAGSVSNEG